MGPGLDADRPRDTKHFLATLLGVNAPRLASRRELFGIDLRTLALFRVLLGGYLLVDLYLRSRDLSAHYTDFGIMPRDVAMSYLSSSSFSIHLMSGSTTFQAGLFLLAAMFAVMLVIGWRSRLATFACWFLLLSLQNRNTLILSGEDNLALLLLFWAMFLPTGARWSVDAALNEEGEDRDNSFCSIGTAALLLQGVSMYFFSALLKSDDVWMPDGTAAYYALNLDYFATPFALWLRQFEGLLQGLTYYVWVLELVGPILIFSPILNRPIRAWLMGCFISMHVGFWMCLEIGLFPVISIIMNLAFLPGWMWDALKNRLPYEMQSHVHIWYDRDCAFCRKICHLIATFLFLRDIPIAPAQSDERIGKLLEETNSWVITDGHSDYIRWNAICRLFAASPVFWLVAPLLSLRLLNWAGDGAYRWVARNRQGFAALTRQLLVSRPIRIRPVRTVNVIAATAFLFITIQNVSTLPSAGLRLPEEFKAVRQFLGLYQYWTMFAPHPEMNSPWPVIQGELDDGTVVDVYNMRVGAPQPGRPTVVSNVYANSRWRKFLSNLEDQSYNDVPQRLALNYSRYLCRKWSAEFSSSVQLSVFSIAFNVDWTRPPGTPKDTTVTTVWTHDCFG